MRLSKRVLAVLPLLVSCRHGGPGPVPDRTAAEVLAAARAARVAYVTATETIEIGYGGAEATGEGSVDLLRGRSFLQVDAKDVIGVPDLQELVDGSTTYLRRTSRPGWLRFRDTVGTGFHPTLAFDLLATADPLTRAEAAEVPVRGEPTIHYRGHVTSPTRSFDVWVDRQGLPLRITVVVGTEPTATKTYELRDWGRAPDVALPPSSTPVKDVTAAYDGLGAS